jgi:hypothetical protein
MTLLVREQRWCVPLSKLPSGLITKGGYYAALMLAFVFAVALVAAFNLGAGWWWDIAGGIGFVALALFGFLNLATGYGARLAAHRTIGWWALGLTVLHAALYLILDPIAVNHLKISAPPAMLVGMATFCIAGFGALISLSRWKMRAHGSRDNFRYYHRLMSWAVLAGSLYHIAATAHSVYLPVQTVLLVGGAILVLLLAANLSRRRQPNPSMVGTVLLSVLAVCSFAALRNV